VNAQQLRRPGEASQTKADLIPGLVCESFIAPGTAQEAQSNISKILMHRYNRIRLHHFNVVLAPAPFATLKPLLTLKVGRLLLNGQ
jgi:hypothetical protein